MQTIWTDVDRYFEDVLSLSDPILDAALAANKKAGLPSIDVSSAQGKFLDLLVRISGAKRVLEIGTLGGYSTICFARAVGETGRVVTLELNPDYAAIATANLKAAGVLDRVEIKLGRAIETLPTFGHGAGAPFDLIFIDADKASTADYVSWALKLSRPGTVIVVDNVVRKGKVVEGDSDDADTQGIRRFFDMAKNEPRFSLTALQTVGTKGHDGFALALVL